MKVLIDTSVWIEFYHPKGNEKAKRKVKEALEFEGNEIGTAAPIIAEILTGAQSEEKFEVLWGDLKGLTCLPLSQQEGVAAGRIARRLAQEGKKVPLADLLIAGAAQVHEYQVWHFGNEHFELITSFGGPVQQNLKRS